MNLSRALGDFMYKKNKNLKPEEQIISCFPGVRRQLLGVGDRYLILGCDGIWERTSNQKAADLVVRLLEGKGGMIPAIRPRLSGPCSALLDATVSGNPIKTGGLGCDNMSMIVVAVRAKAHTEPPGSPKKLLPAAAKLPPAPKPQATPQAAEVAEAAKAAGKEEAAQKQQQPNQQPNPQGSSDIAGGASTGVTKLDHQLRRGVKRRLPSSFPAQPPRGARGIASSGAGAPAVPWSHSRGRRMLQLLLRVGRR